MKFQLNEYHGNITNEDLLNDLMSVYTSLGKSTVTQSEYTKLGKYGVNTFRRRFGGWNQSLELCGISPNDYQIGASKSSHNHLTVTTEELLYDLQYVAQQLFHQLNIVRLGSFQNHLTLSTSKVGMPH